MRPLLLLVAVLSLAAHAEAAPPPDDFDRLSLGAFLGDADNLAVLRKKTKTPFKDGAYIRSAFSHSPCEKAGLDALDVVTYVGSKRIHTAEQLRDAVAAAPAGKDLKLKGFKATVAADGNAIRFSAQPFRVRPAPLGQILLAGARKREDEVRGIVFYHDIDGPESATARTDTEAYFGVENGKPDKLRIRLTWRGKDWLFIRRYVIKADDRTFAIEPPLGVGVERKVLSGAGVAEWYDCAPDNLAEIIEAAQDSVKVTLRCEGDHDVVSDRSVDAAERARLWRMMMLHRMLSR